MKKIVIYRSSRDFGNTRKITEKILGQFNIELINLNKLDITPFDYEHRNSKDDFIPLIISL
jgi:flavodoxin